MTGTMSKDPDSVVMAEFLYRVAFFIYALTCIIGLIGGFISVVFLGATFSPAEDRAIISVICIIVLITTIAMAISGVFMTEHI